MVNALGIQELADDIGGLQVADGGAVVLDGRVEVVLGVKVVRMAALDLGHHLGTCLQTQMSALLPCSEKSSPSMLQVCSGGGWSR